MCTSWCGQFTLEVCCRGRRTERIKARLCAGAWVLLDSKTRTRLKVGKNMWTNMVTPKVFVAWTFYPGSGQVVLRAICSKMCSECSIYSGGRCAWWQKSAVLGGGGEQCVAYGGGCSLFPCQSVLNGSTVLCRSSNTSSGGVQHVNIHTIRVRKSYGP